MSIKFNKEDNTLQITDANKALERLVNSINEITVKLKNRNLTKEDKSKLHLLRKESVKQMIDITASAINAGMIQEDKYKVLTANVDKKVFKDCSGHVNSICKDYLSEKEKLSAHKGAQLSDTELAKLIETPNVTYTPVEDTEEGYDSNNMKQVEPSEVPEANDETVVDITATDGTKIRVDKENNHIYLEGKDKDGNKVTWKKKLVAHSYIWYETAKNLAVALFGLCWNLVMTSSVAVFQATTGLVSTAIKTTVNFGKNLFEDGSMFGKAITSAREKAKQKASSRGMVWI